LSNLTAGWLFSTEIGIECPVSKGAKRQYRETLAKECRIPSREKHSNKINALTPEVRTYVTPVHEHTK